MPPKGKTHKGLPLAAPVSIPVQDQSRTPVNLAPDGLPLSKALSVGTAGQGVTVDPSNWSEYERLSSHPFAGDPAQQNLNSLQSGWEVAKNAVAGGAVNVGAGFMDAIGSWDLGDTFDMAAGVEKQYGNWFHDMSTKLSEFTQEQFPIYEKDPGSFSPSDPAWWAKQGQGLGHTLGFAAEALVEQLVLGAATGGLGNEIAMASKIKALNNLSRAAKVSSAKEALWGGFKGIQEATTNGYQTFDQTKQKYIEQGYSEDKATRLASVAASDGFIKEIGPLMALNALQYSTLAYNPVAKKTHSAIFGSIENKTLRRGAELGSEMISEGLEEGWQTIASKEGAHRADVVAGLATDNSFGERMGTYLDDAELWNSTVGGLLGGGMFTGMKGVQNKVFPDIQAREQNVIYEKYQKGLQGMTIDYLKQIREAEEAGRPKQAAQLKRDMSVQTALQSHHIDQLKGDSNGTTLNSHLSTLKGILKAAETGDAETLATFKITDTDIPYITQEFPKMIQEAENVTKIYDGIKNTNDESVLIPLAYRMHLVGKLNEEVGAAQASVVGAKQNIPDASNLTPRGQELLDTSYTHEAITTEEDRLKKLLKNSSGQSAENIRARLSELGIMKGVIDLRREELLSQSVSEEERAQDKEILSSIPHQSELYKAKLREVAAKTELKRTRKELAVLSDKKYQVSSAQGKLKRLIEEATTEEEIDSIINSLNNNKQATAETKAQAELKKKSIKAQSAGQTINATAKQHEQQVPENKEVETNAAAPKSIMETLRDLGYTQDQITSMSATQAQAIYTAKTKAPSAPATTANTTQTVTAKAGETNAPILDVNALSQERADLAKDIDFSSGNAGPTEVKFDFQGDRIVIQDDPGLWLPDQIDRKATAEQKQAIANKVRAYVENLANELGKEVSEVSFREFVRDYIRHATSEVAERNFNIWKEAWGWNNLKETNFDSDYSALFGNRVDMATELATLAQGITAPSQEQVEENNEQAEQKTTTQEVIVEELPTGEKVARTKDFKTVNPTLKLGHLSMEYSEVEVTDDFGVTTTAKINSETLLKGTDIDSRELNNPFLYGPGTELTVEVAPDFENYVVTDWSEDFKTKGGMSFAAWAVKHNVQRDSPEWIAKLPMVVRNADGKAIAYIHDYEWYNPRNVGRDESKEIQDKIIADARQELTKLRNTVMSKGGSLSITVTEKKVGTKVEIPKHLPRITLLEADPTCLVGFINSAGVIVVNGGTILPSQLVPDIDGKAPKLDLGEQYEFRHVGMTNIIGENGKPKQVKQYLKLEVVRPKSPEPALFQTMVEAMRVYLAQHDTTGRIMPVETRKKIRDEVLKINGVDLYDKKGIHAFIKQFVKTISGDFTVKDSNGKINNDATLESIYNTAASKLHVGTPFITTQHGAIVFGINGKVLSPSSKLHVRYANPSYMLKNPIEAARRYNDFLNQLSQTSADPMNTMTVLQRMSLSLDDAALTADNDIAFISSTGEVTNKGKYSDYIKSQFTTNVKAFNEGVSPDNAVYATTIQPVIHFTYEGDTITEAEQQRIESISSEPALAEQTIPVNSAEEQEIFEKMKQDAEFLAKFGVDVNKLLGDKDSLALPNYAVDTDALIAEVKEKLTRVSDMDISARSETVRFIARQIEARVDTKFHSTITRQNVLDSVQGLLNETVDADYQRLQGHVNMMSRLIATGTHENLRPAMNSFIDSLNQIDTVRKNWDVLVNEALAEVYKNTGIVEVTQGIPELAAGMVRAHEEDSLGGLISNEELAILKAAAKGDKKAFREAVVIYNEVAQFADEASFEEIDIDSEEFAGDTGDERLANYTRTSLQENNKESVSYLFRRFTAQIPEYGYASSAPKTGFAGLLKYPGYGHYFDKIEAILTSPTDCPADYNAMIQRLRENEAKQPWITDFIQRLEAANEQVKAAFVYGLNLHGASFKFFMWSKNKGDTYTGKVYDTNANEIERVIQNQWYENFKMSELVKDIPDSKEYVINTDVAASVLAQFESWGKTKEKVPNATEAREWLAKFGIRLSPEAVAEIIEKGYKVISKNQTSNVTYENMFINNSASHGIFGLLYNRLKTVIDNSKATPELLNVTESSAVGIPLNNATSVLGRLAKIEKKYSPHTATTSVRDGSKNLFGLTNQKMSLQQLTKLKTDEDYRNELLGVDFNGGSFMLNLLNVDMDFREKFKVDHIGINAIKELGKKPFRDNEITSVSDIDHEYTKVGMFQDIQQGEVKEKSVTVYGKTFNLDMRIARFFFPTMSDKSTMLDLTTAAVNLRKGNELLVENGNVYLSDNALAFAFSQFIEPELKRIIKHHQTAKALGKHANNLTNQAGYNMGAQVFLGLTEMNNLKYRDVPLPHYLAENAASIDEAHYNELLANIKQDMNILLQNHFSKKVEQKLKTWTPFKVTDKQGKVTGHRFLSKTYMDEFHEANPELRLTYAAYDYVFNSYLANANMSMMFTGDPANFSKDSAFSSKNFYTDDKGRVLPYAAKTEEAYSQAIKGVIDVNIGKRLAMLIAPGKSLYNSVNDKYIQIFLQDQVSATTNIPFLVGLYYGQDKVTPAITTAIEQLTSADDVVAESTRVYLQRQFPLIKDYLDIETTDAQEYTTAKEAVDILFRQGRLHPDVYNMLLAKIQAQQRAEDKGEAIPESAKLTDEEIKLVFSPLKPVYSGQITDNSSGMPVSRVVYIKSSSFPLLPQTTQAFPPLNALRRDMEKIQAKTGKNVRVTYNSAAKVGAVALENQKKIWDNSGNYVPNALEADTLIRQINGDINAGPLLSAMVLDRENFRIQQDVPYKSSKRTEDIVSVGTQMMKTLFGDGILEIPDAIFDYNGEKITARDLYQKYTNAFGGWIRNEKSQLYTELGIDEATGKATDVVATAKKLQKILQSEATKRGYPQQDIDALTIEADGAFTVPVWISPNSNRYEALLNAIVANRLINLKLPGTAYVLGSEEGFRTGTEGVDLSGVVFTDAWKGQLEAATYDAEGNLLKAQVLVPSKFRNNKGELIDLIKDGYATKADGKWKLDTSKIDPELLSLTSFRIPTSGHVSMSQIEIVGFLPVEQADLMILPKNFTKQKGLDFDVDKENTYQLWHMQDADGKLVPISSSTVRDTPRMKTKLLQNEIINIHKAVLGNADPRVQQKINKVLSMDFARSQAKLISEASTAPDRNFSIWDDEHQKYKLGLGAAGKSGIGVYSNYVVFHNLAQQAEKDIQLMTTVDNRTEPYIISLGGLHSDGKLGNLLTLDGDRSIADVLAERQNTATDNEKEQIMGRVGVNDMTIGVDSLLSVLGFDKGIVDGKEVSIPYLFLSQPIIKDYVELMKAGRSTIAGFNPDLEASILATLAKDYPVGDSVEILQGATRELRENLRSDLTAQAMFDNLATTNNLQQHTALDLFLELDKYAREISQIQSRINIQNSGLGKSIFEMLEKYENVTRMEYSSKIAGIDSLIGEYITGDRFRNTSASSLAEQGFVTLTNPDGGQYAVKPTTPIGHMLVNATKAGYELWGDFFPHQHPAIQAVMKRIMSHISDEATSEAKRITFKFNIMQEMKKYLFSSSALGLFTGDPQVERARLFMDRPRIVVKGDKDLREDDEVLSAGNTSLATYLSNLATVKSASANRVSTNRLISAFTYDLNKNGNPSFFRYDNAKGEDTNEEYKYSALVELMDSNEVIRDGSGNPILYNGQEYTTRQLAKDMIIYTYLQGGIQKATEIVKYIPVPYLKASGFAAVARQWQAAAKAGASGRPMTIAAGNQEQEFWSMILGHNPDPKSSVAGRFERQYIQHNAASTSKIPEGLVKSPRFTNSFSVSPEMVSQLGKYCHIKESKNEVYLFEYDEAEGVYHKIPVLGTGGIGLSEYSIRENNATSIVNPNPGAPRVSNPPAPLAPASADVKRETTFGLDTGNLNSILSRISEQGYGALSITARELIPFVVNDVKIVIEDMGASGPRGRYVNSSKTIIINSAWLNASTTTPEQLAQAILHEFTHAITQTELDTYFNPDGSFKQGWGFANVPAHITKLHRTFNLAVNKLGQDQIQEFAKYFFENRTVRNETDYMLYAGMDIREFLATIMSSPELQAKMNEVSVDSEGTTLLQRFIDSLKKILEAIGIPLNTVTANAFESTFAIATAQQAKTNTPTVTAIAGVKGINISTKSSDPLGRALTNPTWGAKKDGLNLFDVETAYKKAKSKNPNPEIALGEDMDTMYSLIMEKFRRHPELVTQITQRGGEAFLAASSHDVGTKNSRWEGKGYNSNFIRVLTKAYKDSVPTVTATSGNFDLNSEIDKAQAELEAQQKREALSALAEDISVRRKRSLQSVQGNQFDGDDYSGGYQATAYYYKPLSEAEAFNMSPAQHEREEKEGRTFNTDEEAYAWINQKFNEELKAAKDLMADPESSGAIEDTLLPNIQSEVEAVLAEIDRC